MEKQLFQFIETEFNKLGCELIHINGTSNHVHCLFLLNPTKAVSDVLKQVKGASSHFMNRDNFIYEKFGWQTGYAVFSVSESIVEKVSGYIKNQKQHHLKKSFDDELKEFMKRYNLNG